MIYLIELYQTASKNLFWAFNNLCTHSYWINNDLSQNSLNNFDAWITTIIFDTVNNVSLFSKKGKQLILNRLKTWIATMMDTHCSRIFTGPILFSTFLYLKYCFVAYHFLIVVAGSVCGRMIVSNEGGGGRGSLLLAMLVEVKKCYLWGLMYFTQHTQNSFSTKLIEEFMYNLWLWKCPS